MKWLSVLLVACVGVCLGAAPTVELTADKQNAKPNQLVVVTVGGSASSVKYRVVGDADWRADTGGKLLYIVAKSSGVKVMAWGASKDGEVSDLAELTLGAGATDPVKPVDPVDPPKPGEPPVPIPFGDKFYFVVIRADGPVDPAVAQALRLPEWDELRKDGHQMKDYPAKSVPVGIKVPATLPALLTLRISEDGKKSRIVGDPQPLPTTGVAVKELVK